MRDPVRNGSLALYSIVVSSNDVLVVDPGRRVLHGGPQACSLDPRRHPRWPARRPAQRPCSSSMRPARAARRRSSPPVGEEGLALSTIHHPMLPSIGIPYTNQSGIRMVL